MCIPRQHDRAEAERFNRPAGSGIVFAPFEAVAARGDFIMAYDLERMMANQQALIQATGAIGKRLMDAAARLGQLNLDAASRLPQADQGVGAFDAYAKGATDTLRDAQQDVVKLMLNQGATLQSLVNELLTAGLGAANDPTPEASTSPPESTPPT